MTDLDFDELDRAVNSLISSSSSTRPKDNDDEKTLTLEDTLPVVESASETPVEPTVPEAQVANEVVNNEPVAAPIVSSSITTHSTQPLAAKRSSGRFMDVVHPSSDMRPGGAVSAPVVHSAPALTPSTSFSTVDTGVTVEPVVPLPEAPVANEWPDPLDYTAPKDVPAVVVETPVPAVEEEPPIEADDDIDQIANDIDNSLKNPPDDVQTSPFLADTKVDKRPLGAFSTEAAVTPVTPVLEAVVPLANETVAPADTPVESEATDAQIPPTSDPEIVLPEELQSTILSIESTPASLETSAVPESTEAPLSPTVDVQPAQPEVPIGPTAITQQYKEEPSTGDQQSGAIFDTKSYHKALPQPTKKKRSFMWITWVLILVILGGGVGVCIYYFVLPALT